MLNKIYWDKYSVVEVKSIFFQDEVDLIFENSEYRNAFPEKITLALHLGKQTVLSKIEYTYNNGLKENLDYKLVGAFDDDSFELFKGTWIENNEKYRFDALLYRPILEEKVIAREIQIEHIESEKEKVNAEVVQKMIEDRYGANRQRAVRGHARVRTIQRNIELYYGLPEEAVKLVNPDRSIIHPSAKIRTLRERWTFDE